MMQLKFGQQQKLMDLLSQHHGTNVQNGQDTDFTSYMESPDFMSQVTAMGALDPEMLKLAEAIRQNKQARITAMTTQHPNIAPTLGEPAKQWDPTANQGQGGYVAMPGTAVTTPAPRAPEQIQLDIANTHKAEADTAKTIADTATWDQPKAMAMVNTIFQSNPNSPTAAKYRGMVQLETNPVQLGALVKQASDEQKELNQKNIEESFMASQTNKQEAFQNLQTAKDKMEQATTGYMKKRDAANNVLTMIDLAKGGNMVGYTYEPRTGFLNVNMAGGGSVRVPLGDITEGGGDWDKVLGWLGSHASGQTIDARVLDQAQQVHERLAFNAKDSWRASRSGIASTYQINPPEVLGQLPPDPQKPLSPGQFLQQFGVTK
jgi:hypothetical protein